MLDNEIIDEIKMFLSFLYLKHPFYNSLISSLDLELERTKLSKKYKIYSKNNKSIFIDYDFAAQQLNENKRLFFYYIIHELLHIILKHKLRGIGKIEKKWNTATDIAIDALIQKDKVLKSLIQTPDEANGIGKIYNYGDEVSETAEDIYLRLKNQKDEDKNDDSGKREEKKDGDSSHLNNHDIWNSEEDGNPLEDENVINEMLVKAVQMVKLQEGMKQSGGIPGGFEEVLNELLNPKTSLLDYIAKVVQNFKSYQSTYKRGDRRYLYKDLIVPSKIKNIKHFKLLFYVDTSGSVGLEELQEVMSELFYIINSLKSYEIDIIQSDSGLQDVYQITNKTGFDIDKLLKIKGRGGTEMKPLFEHLKENRYDFTLVSSDYYISDEEINGLDDLSKNIDIGFIVTKEHDKEKVKKLSPVFKLK